MEGTKHDQGKLPIHLFPVDALWAITKVLGFGAHIKNYGERNWELGMDWSRVYAALQRHLTAWWNGEDRDEESGYSHLWHVGCCAVFLISYELRGIGKDDRPPKT